jgi:hypothetical protein
MRKTSNDLVKGLALILFSTAGAAALTAQTASGKVHEQTSFSAEDEGVKNPVSVPQDIILLLTKDDYVRRAMENADPVVKAPPQDWFSASVVHLSASGEEDLIVQAKGPLRGANVDTFWVFLRTPNGAELVLTAPVHDLAIKRARHNGYRDIELLGATAVEWSTTLLRFNGRKYEVYRSKCGPDPC